MASRIDPTKLKEAQEEFAKGTKACVRGRGQVKGPKSSGTGDSTYHRLSVTIVSPTCLPPSLATPARRRSTSTGLFKKADWLGAEPHFKNAGASLSCSPPHLHFAVARARS